jgi:hypothetical protein
MYDIVKCETGALYKVHQDTNRVRSTSDPWCDDHFDVTC